MIKTVNTILLAACLILAIRTTVLADDNQTTVFFVDACTGDQTYVNTPNGTQLEVDIKNLAPNTETDLNLEYVPAGLTQDLAKKYKVINEFTYDSDSKGELHLLLYLPRDRNLNNVESQIPGFNIWNVNVVWEQTDTNNKTITGTGNSSVYRLQGTAPFFKIKSASTCFWETRPSISSDYYYNEDSNLMEIHRNLEIKTGSGGMGGFTLGNVPNLGEGGMPTLPLGSVRTMLPAFGWFFGEWSKQQSLLQSVEVTRDWNLSKFSGGFFFDRYSFYRVDADRYEWVRKSNSCGSYAKIASGSLDIGSRLSEFYSIPLSDSGSPDRVLKFLEELRPTADTCQDGVNTNAKRASFLISSDKINTMFFYPTTQPQTTHNQGEKP